MLIEEYNLKDWWLKTFPHLLKKQEGECRKNNIEFDEGLYHILPKYAI